ncbi:hypothetical protein M0802_004684 [Mischocyttarus mexicanus]|nr:hypothetical protein M0802_004684 [Mischocyttarus mexicanus]
MKQSRTLFAGAVKRQYWIVVSSLARYPRTTERPVCLDAVNTVETRRLLSLPAGCESVKVCWFEISVTGTIKQLHELYELAHSSLSVEANGAHEMSEAPWPPNFGNHTVRCTAKQTYAP